MIKGSNGIAVVGIISSCGIGNEYEEWGLEDDIVTDVMVVIGR